MLEQVLEREQEGQGFAGACARLDDELILLVGEQMERALLYEE